MTKWDKQDDLTNAEYDGGEEGVHVPEGGEGGPAPPEQVHNIVEEIGEDEDTEDDVIWPGILAVDYIKRVNGAEANRDKKQKFK